MAWLYSKLTVYFSIDAKHSLQSLKRQQNNCITAPAKCLFNINIEANIVDPDQTAPRSSLIWVHTVFYEASRQKTHIL